MADLGFQLSSFRLLLSVSISITLLCQLVRCQTQVKEGRIRIDPGPREGLVEVFSEEQWGTISNENLDENTPTVICRELGFNGPADTLGGTVYKGPLNSPVWRVVCTESASSISECDVTKSESTAEFSIDYSSVEMFDHSNDLGIICRDPPEGNGFLIIDIVLFVVTILFIIFFAFMAYHFSKKRKSEARDDRRDPRSNPDQVDEETELSGSGRGDAPHEYERHMPEAHPLHDMKGAESTTYLTVP